MLKKLDKLLNKLDFRDWEERLNDPDPHPTKSLLLAILGFPVAFIIIAIVVTILFFIIRSMLGLF